MSVKQARKKRIKVETLTCPQCGKKFKTTRRRMCSKECRAEWLRGKSDFSKRTVVNDFLPADAEENRYRIPVPSPEEIASQVAILRASKMARGE